MNPKRHRAGCGPARRAGRHGARRGRRRRRLAPAGAPAAAARRAARSSSTGSSGPVRVRRDRWGVPHIEAAAEADLFFAEGFCHGQDRLFQMDFYRRVVRGRLSEIAGPETLPVDRLMLTLGIRRAAEREAAALDPERARRARALLRRRQRRRRDAPGRCPSRCSCCASASSTPGARSTSSASASCSPSASRPTGSGSCCAPTWCARSARSWRPGSTPTYPVGNPIATQEPWSGDGLALVEQIDAVRRSIGLATEASGSNNWAVSGRSQRHRLAADRRRPAPAAEHAGHLVPGRPARSATASSAAPRCPGCPASTWARTTTSAGPSPTSMADVQDLFVERVEGDSYLFEDEWRPLEIVARGDPGQGPRRARGARGAQHPPRPDRQRGARRRRRRAAGAALADARRADRLRRACSSCTRSTPAPSWSRRLEGHTAPASNLIWADRHGSIGYKLIGRLPLRRGGCPDLPKPGWTGEFEWEGTIPYDGAAGGRRPRERLPGHRQQPDRRRRLPAPHHQRVVRRLPRASGSKQLLARRATSTTSTTSRRCRPTSLSLPGPRGGAAARPAEARAASASAARSSGCAAGTAGSTPETIAGTIYQAFLLRLAARGGARRDRRPRPRRALARPRRQRLHRPRHLALALALAPDEALGGGRRGADRPALGRARAGEPRRRPRRPRRPLRPRPRGLALGPTSTRWSSRTRSATPTRCCGACSTAGSRPAAPRRRSARSPTTPTTPTAPSGRRAGGWSPTRPPPSARAGRCSPASPATRPAPTTTTCRPTGSRAAPSRWPARAPGRSWSWSRG